MRRIRGPETSLSTLESFLDGVARIPRLCVSFEELFQVPPGWYSWHIIWVDLGVKKKRTRGKKTLRREGLPWICGKLNNSSCLPISLRQTKVFLFPGTHWYSGVKSGSRAIAVAERPVVRWLVYKLENTFGIWMVRRGFHLFPPRSSAFEASSENRNTYALDIPRRNNGQHFLSTETFLVNVSSGLKSTIK
ncbi:hypothetical protein KQX54_020937 [Cotesia glomerata]|uniref:Maturase K n=1 Tax=Cotesia glomerata TaxID=32391 RepID=A0AAV7JAC1_COTGL|nr:hypothetical protein KQX54_020937 [Cotesia glomerata]